MSKVNREVEELRQKIVSWGKWQHQDCDPMCGDKAFEDIEITDCVRELDELLYQARNSLLREIMEEMPKKMFQHILKDIIRPRLGCIEFCPACIQQEYIDQVNTLLESKLSTVKKK